MIQLSNSESSRYTVLAPVPDVKKFEAWVPAFMLFLFLCQIALLLPALAPLRVVFRIASFGSSLAMLALLRGSGERHPAWKPGLCVLLIMSAQLFHPSANTLTAGVAQIALYTAVLGPLFWVPKVRVDLEMLRRLIQVIWGFHLLSAMIAVSQVVRPGSFQFAVSPMIAARGEDYLRDLSFQSMSGQIVFRPMGLSDIPGGAANSGFYALLFGMGFLIIDQRFWHRLFYAASFGVGMLALYLSQVRSVLLIAVVCLAAFAVVLFWRKHWGRVGMIVGLLTFGLVAGYQWSSRLSSGGTASNLMELVSADPGQVFFQNRGQFLAHTIEVLLPRYPLGAGLGRWGMTNAYFGSSDNPATAPIWVEVQLTGWLLDGGIPLIIAYVIAVAIACFIAFRFSRRPTGGSVELSLWSALILAYNLGAVALTFSYPLFIAQWGMEFWLLNATLFAAAVNMRNAEMAERGAPA